MSPDSIASAALPTPEWRRRVRLADLRRKTGVGIMFLGLGIVVGLGLGLSLGLA